MRASWQILALKFFGKRLTVITCELESDAFKALLVACIIISVLEPMQTSNFGSMRRTGATGTF